MQGQCILCGKTATRLYDHACHACFVKKHGGEIRVPPTINLYACAECGRFRSGGDWAAAENPEPIYEYEIAQRLEVPKGFERGKMELQIEPEDEKNLRVHGKVAIHKSGAAIMREFDTRIRLKNDLCPVCSRYRGSYYEATLQIRGPGADMMGAEIGRLAKDRSGAGTYKARTLINREEKVAGGADYYFTEMSVAKQLARELSETFGAQYNESAKLWGVKEGRNVYRLTYLVRLPAFRAGDFVVYKKSLCRVIEVKKGYARISGISMQGEERVERKDFDRLARAGGTELVRDAVVLSETAREMQVMDPDTYKTVILVKPKGYRRSAENAKVIKWEETLHLLQE